MKEKWHFCPTVKDNIQVIEEDGGTIIRCPFFTLGNRCIASRPLEKLNADLSTCFVLEKAKGKKTNNQKLDSFTKRIVKSFKS